MQTRKRNFVIDCRKWVCGPAAGERNENNSLGHGHNNLLNSAGYMCCLGMISEQCGVSRDRLIDRGHPIGDEFPNFLFDLSKHGRTKLTTTAIAINDGPDDSLAERITKLTELFAENGLKLKFTHIPKHVKEQLLAKQETEKCETPPASY